MRDCANCFHRKPVLKEDGTWTAECEKWDCEFQSRENMVEKTEAKQGDLISRSALIKAVEQGEGISWKTYHKEATCVRKKYIDNAPTVVKQKGEREFIEILTQYVPDDLCTYPEYREKPYYSIHYRENGEEFVGYGTYKIEVLSRYLQDYFFNIDMKGG